MRGEDEDELKDESLIVTTYTCWMHQYGLGGISDPKESKVSTN